MGKSFSGSERSGTGLLSAVHARPQIPLGDTEEEWWAALHYTILHTASLVRIQVLCGLHSTRSGPWHEDPVSTRESLAPHLILFETLPGRGKKKRKFLYYSNELGLGQFLRAEIDGIEKNLNKREFCHLGHVCSCVHGRGKTCVAQLTSLVVAGTRYSENGEGVTRLAVGVPIQNGHSISA